MERFEAVEYVEDRPELIFKKRLDNVVNHELTVDNIGRYADEVICELIDIVDDVVAKYQAEVGENPGLSQMVVEDQAFSYYGLVGIGRLLDQAQEKVQMIARAGDFLKTKVVDSNEVITPPGPKLSLGNERKSIFEVPGTKNRLLTLLYILEKHNIDTDSFRAVRGTVTEDMVRREPYVTIDIPELNRVVYVCDEEQNATYIFDRDKLDSITIDRLDQMTKQEKLQLIKNNPLVGVRLFQDNHWVENMEEYLFSDLVDPETLSQGESGGLNEVARGELDPWRGFWTNPDGLHFGPVSALVGKVGFSAPIIERALIDIPDLPTITIRSLSGKKLLAYPTELIKEYFRDKGYDQNVVKVEKDGDWEGFHIDKDSKHWGTVKSIARKLERDSSVVDGIIAQLSLKSQKIKHRSGLRDAYPYEVIKDHHALLTKSTEAVPSVESIGEWADFYTDKDGKHWGAMYIISKKSKLKDSVVQNLVARHPISNKQIRGINNRVVTAYCYEDVLGSLKEKGYLDSPKAEISGEWEGFWISPDGQHFGSIVSIADRLKISDSFVGDIIDQQDQLLGVKVKDTQNKIRTFYPIEPIQTYLNSKGYSEAPVAEKEGDWKGFYIDKDGIHWGAINSIAEKLEMTFSPVKRVVEGLSLKNLVIHSARGLNDAYPYEVVRQSFETDNYFEAPAVTKDGDWRGFYVDESGKHWGPISVMAKKTGFKDRDLLRHKSRLGSIKKVKNLADRISDGYCYEDVVEYMNKQKSSDEAAL